MHDLTDYERGFLEGAIDFEGRLGMFGIFRSKLNKRYFQTIGQIFNTNLEVLTKINMMLDEECKAKPEVRNVAPFWKPCFVLTINTSTLRWLLPQLNLTVKRKQKDIIMEFLSLKKNKYGRLSPIVYARQRELFDLMKAANRRGRGTN